jgi:CRP/FNR family transcriptional regulator, cyclic AMP receptor protein
MSAPQIKTCQPLPDIESVLPILDKISILGGLTEKQLVTVFRKMEQVSYRTGEVIFEQGDRPSHIYIICSGRVKMVTDVEGTPMELVEYGEGQCFGETSAIGILPHSATALVEEDTHLIVLSGPAIHSLYREDPALFGILILNIAREACRRLHRTDEIMLHYASRKAR